MRPRQPPDTQKPQSARQQANDRLAQALRDNLHRRKAQARARIAAQSADAGGTIPSDFEDPREIIQDAISKKAKS